MDVKHSKKEKGQVSSAGHCAAWMDVGSLNHSDWPTLGVYSSNLLIGRQPQNRFLGSMSRVHFRRAIPTRSSEYPFVPQLPHGTACRLNRNGTFGKFWFWHCLPLPSYSSLLSCFTFKYLFINRFNSRSFDLSLAQT